MPPFIIDDSTHTDVTHDTKFGRGYKERDFAESPQEMFAQPSEMNLIPRSEWSARVKEQKEQGSNLSAMRLRALPGGSHIPSLDQNGQGYCWSYSTAMCIMMKRMTMGQPYVRLSAHAVACKIKNFRDDGGWCGLSAQFLKDTGVPDIAHWPEKSMAKKNDNKATWENAANYRLTDDWVDLARPVYDRNLTFDQVASCLLRNEPVALDYNWWGHSICGMSLIEVEPGDFGIEIINSWTDRWGDNGTAILRGSKKFPDGAVGIISTTPSAAPVEP